MNEFCSAIPSLNYLFPKLRIIRGDSLISNYALVLYQNQHLIEIGLPNLVEISKGGVRISENPVLCYADTINWAKICKEFSVVPPLIELNQNPSTL